MIHEILKNAGKASEIIIKNAIISTGAVIAGLVAVWIVFFFLKRVTRASANKWGDKIIPPLQKPFLFLIPVMGIRTTFAFTTWPQGWQVFLFNLSNLLLIASAAYLAARIAGIFQDLIIKIYDISVSDNLHARKMATQIKIFHRIIIAVIIVIAVALAFMNFTGMRQIGASLLASAGITGIILGLAAQKTLSSVFAGIQIAISQPIRVDDVVIVENEWGRIEEITLTYVVVRIWDMRRLILPITYFLEKPFQNWTRVSSDILGTIFIYTDYSFPVESARTEAKKFVEGSDYWDGKVCEAVITECKPDVMEVRILVSATDSSKAWNLRCALREHLIRFIQENYPQCLPKLRAEVKQ